MRIESLLKWLKETPADVAETRCREHGTSVGYLRQVAYGNKLAGLKGADIERITENRCTRQDLRPHDYDRIWPELAKAKQLPRAQGAGRRRVVEQSTG